MSRRRLAATALASLAVGALAACGSTGGDPDPDVATGADGGAGALEGEVVVFAAASLAGSFEDIAGLLEAEHPGLTVRLVTDGSSTLVTQLGEGAAADVLATADEATMADALDAGLVVDPASFATNQLVIATPAGNPAGVASLADLAALDVVTCAPEVPCGAATARALDAAGVSLTPVSEEQAVSAVVAKVAAGEADAGLVYATDVLGSDGALEAVAIPDAPVNTYPIALTAEPADPEAAAAFVELVRSPAGQEVLAAAGFGAP